MANAIQYNLFYFSIIVNKNNKKQYRFLTVITVLLFIYNLLQYYIHLQNFVVQYHLQK